ncbi:unnamed protein product [Mytilus coruscus]|uniref:Reverse transcriptase domain-containing protein n=1 Tax=Mytilus coruscus TaxID=42192 RepID=A0A6J8DPW0_MYTCO|nr:unnamed protein product [Mytilus coruscus]
MANANAEANQDQESVISENDVLFRKYMENDTTIARNNTLVIYVDESNTDFQRETAEQLNTRDVLFTLQSSVNISDLIICFQKSGKSSYLATCRDEHSLETFLNEFQTFVVNDTTFRSRRAEPLNLGQKDYIDVIVFGLPFEIKPMAVRKKFEIYGEIQKLISPTFKEFPNIQSGVRIVRMNKLYRQIPKKLYIKGQSVSIKYEGQPQEGLDKTQGINKDKTKSTPTLIASKGEKHAKSGDEIIARMSSSNKPYSDAVKDGCDIASVKTPLPKQDKIDSNNMNCRLNKYILDKFKSIKDALRIKDVFREIHNDKANFACYNISGTRTRIDRFYADNEFINKIKEVKHIPYKKSDHKIVQISIQYKRQKWGRAFWKMNNSLLENENYTILISNIIKQWREDKLKYDPLKDFYSELYTSDGFNDQEVDKYLGKIELNKLNEEDWSVSNQFISKEECLNNIKDFENNKSPGIDGLGKEFHLKFWNIIGDEVVEIVNNIYLKGELTETMKMGIITLNYKNKGDKKDLKQWRPISLLCFDYKLITKTLAKRLSKVINKLVDIKQTGAGEEKNIFDNIISISDIFDYMNLNDIKGFLINFDQEKAFDKIKHEFLIKVLKKMNLPVEFIRWIKILYKDIKSKIQVNGQLTEEILITRSVRQGCPLSINLYALAIETLASSIRTNKKIKGINIPNLKDPIKLFQHADDCTTITTDIKDYYLFMNEFEKFGKASGVKK